MTEKQKRVMDNEGAPNNKKAKFDTSFQKKSNKSFKSKSPKDKNEKSKTDSKQYKKPDKSFKSKSPKDKNEKSKTDLKQHKKSDKFNKSKSSSDVKEADLSWKDFKQQKKELKLKRKKVNDLYDVVIEAKKINENLRRKELKGGKEEREKLVNEIHTLLTGHYSKVVLSHDVARIVQFLLKFAPESIRKEIATEILPMTVEMAQSKYARFCLKSLLKYGNGEIRSDVITKMYGYAFKLTRNVVSSQVFEYAYSTFASPQQKQFLIQEFFGDMYKQNKDPQIKHLRDVYRDSEAIKNGTLSATKDHLLKVLDKNLLDSGLVQSIFYQFMQECVEADKIDLINQLAPHIVIISNSKDGVRVAMECIWHGNNKDKKIIMKSIKEHAVELCKHEHGHGTIITLLDSVDDTVLLNKVLITQILSQAKDLSKDEWGRKVLLWLVSPASSNNFHPVFIKELETGYQLSTSKKSPATRREEILGYARSSLLKLIIEEPSYWLSTSSIGVLTLAIIKSGGDAETIEALKALVEVIVNPDWKIKEDTEEISGIEHAGMHMILKKFAQFDKSSDLGFGKIILDSLTDETIKSWLALNRSCFLLVAVYENGTEETQTKMKELLASHLKFLKNQKSSGSQILLKKLSG